MNRKPSSAKRRPVNTYQRYIDALNIDVLTIRIAAEELAWQQRLSSKSGPAIVP